MQNQATADQENNNRKTIQEIYDDCKKRHLSHYKKIIDYALEIRKKVLDEKYLWTDEEELSTLLNKDNPIATAANEQWKWKEIEPYWKKNLNIIRELIKNKSSISPQIYDMLYREYKLQKKAAHFNRLICTLFPGQLLFIPAYTELSKIKISGLTANDWITRNIFLFNYCSDRIKDPDEKKSFYISCFAWDLLRYLIKNEQTGLSDSSTNLRLNMSYNRIIFGAPGTGKSHTIKELTEGKTVFRTTFHPDSDYASFVGCYKPTTKQVRVFSTYGEKAVAVKGADGQPVMEDRIIYKFVPQAFLKAYIEAWKSEEEVYLIIEEINRGNCAQIFGDLFQLLDRKDGVSEYPIKPDNDIAMYIAEELSKIENIPNQVKNGEELILPSNFYIWATMNTSDQSLFPIDSAFKRRWDWQYVPILNAKENWKIEANGNLYDWWSFLEKINEKIGSTTNSEDKKLGYFFCKADENGIISAEKFVNKVIFYLWNDVFKDYDFDGNIFNNEDSSHFSFNKLYNVDGNGEVRIQENKVEQFLNNLNVNTFVVTTTDDIIESNIKDDNNLIKRNPAKFLKVSYNGEIIKHDSSRNTYLEAINKIVQKVGINKVKELNTEITQNPPNNTTRNYKEIGNTGWFVATNNGTERFRDILQKLKTNLNLDDLDIEIVDENTH